MIAILLFLNTFVATHLGEGHINGQEKIIKLPKSSTECRHLLDRRYEGRAFSTFIINQNIDLKGDSVYLPDDCVLTFKKGKIHNGTLIGARTKIDNPRRNIFRNLNIGGRWDIPKISSAFFEDIHKEDKIIEVFKLADSCVENTIVVDKGCYPVSRPADKESIIDICSNTHVIQVSQVEN